MAKSQVALPPGFEVDELPEGFQLEEQSGMFPGISFEDLTRPTQGVDIGAEALRPPDTRGIRQIGATLATGAVADPIAGLAGAGVAAFAGADAGAGVVRGIREDMTVPMGPQGAEMMRGGIEGIPDVVLDAVKNLAGRYSSFADLTAEAFGPAAGAAVKTLPIAIAEVAGFKGAGAILRRSNTSLAMTKGSLARSLQNMAPTVDELKAAAKEAYKAVDNAGVVVSPAATRVLALRARTALHSITGKQRRRAPGIWREVTDLEDAVNVNAGFPVDELVRMRDNLATIAVNRTDNQSKAAAEVLDTIDDALDGLSINKMSGDKVKQVGEQLRTARELYRRSSRGAAVEEAMEAAHKVASGYENGLRIEFRKLARSKKFKRFTKEERTLINNVIEGGLTENTLRRLGRFGWGEGASSSIMGMGVGAGIGAYLGGPAGAAVLPVVGIVSRPLAAKMTRGNAQFALDVIRAGRDSRRVVASYMAHVPRGKRTADELSQLLMNPKLDLNTLKPGGQPLISQAKVQAMIHRAKIAQLAAAAASGSVAAEDEQ